MTLFLLIRHGETDVVGRCLAGRTPGVQLTDKGRRQVAALAGRLPRPDHLVASPMERTQETAQMIASGWALPVETEPLLNEVDFGQWTGRSFEAVDRDDLWHRYHRFRSGIRIPGGEMAIEIQSRMVAALERWKNRCPDGVVALVSHGDPIRYAVAFIAGTPIDLALRFEIDVASVSAVAVHKDGASLLYVNRVEKPA